MTKNLKTNNYGINNKTNSWNTFITMPFCCGFIKGTLTSLTLFNSQINTEILRITMKELFPNSLYKIHPEKSLKKCFFAVAKRFQKRGIGFKKRGNRIPKAWHRIPKAWHRIPKV